MPPDLKKKKLATHELVTYVSERAMVLCWQDKRPVLMLSTYHDNNVQTVQRRSGKSDNSNQATVTHITVIMPYNGVWLCNASCVVLTIVAQSSPNPSSNRIPIL